MARRLSMTEREFIMEEMNPPEHNFRNCNWFNLVEENEYVLSVEVGYWITYLGCKPKYEKQVFHFQKQKLEEFKNDIL